MEIEDDLTLLKEEKQISNNSRGEQKPILKNTQIKDSFEAVTSFDE
jgi:hypothetical protein